MSLLAKKAACVAASCLLALHAGAVHGQNLRQVSASRVIAVTPALQDVRQAPVITDVAIQPNGRLVAAVGDDHFVRIWDMVDGTLLRKLGSHRDWVRGAAFSPDGQVLATAGHDRQLILWNPETGRRLKTVQTTHPVTSLAYSPDGKLLATAGFGSQLKTYKTADGKVAHDFECPCHDMRCVAFSPDGSSLAAGGRDGRVHLWRLSDGQLLFDVQVSTRRLRGMTFSHDGKKIVTAGEDRMIRVLASGNGKELFHMPAHPAKVMAIVAYAPQRLATAGSDNEIHLWDLAARKETARLSGHTGSVAALDCRNETLVSGSFDTTVRIWQVAPNEERDDRADRGRGRRIR